MKNLNEGFEELQKNGSFIYSLKDNLLQKLKFYTTLHEFGEYYNFWDKANFDANLKAFIFRNSAKLASVENAIFCYVDSEDEKVFFHIIKIV